MAKEKKPSKAELEKQKRQTQLATLDHVIETINKQIADLNQRKKKVDLLQSVSLGLYDEVDKLTKKAGADQVTDLALEQVNDFIRDAKALMAEDSYIQRCKEFVPAGDNPEHRDVLIILRQLRQGLERSASDLTPTLSRLRESWTEAKGVRTAVQLILDGYEEITEDDLKERQVGVSERWLEQKDQYDRTLVFSLDVLDRTEIPTYFETAE